jgi:hypothetical protein
MAAEYVEKEKNNAIFHRRKECDKKKINKYEYLTILAKLREEKNNIKYSLTIPFKNKIKEAVNICSKSTINAVLRKL